MEAELVRAGLAFRKHSRRSALGEIPAGGTPARIPNLPLAGRQGCSCRQHSLQNDPVATAETPKCRGLEQIFHPAAASHHWINKTIPELPWQKEPPTGTRSTPALAGQSSCQGMESPRKLQYDSLNYTNCVSWYWGRINTVFLMLDFINTISFSLTLRNCISQFLQTISHQLCSFRFADDW